MCAVPTAPAWLQRAGLGADVMGTGASSGGARAEGVRVAYAPRPECSDRATPHRSSHRTQLPVPPAGSLPPVHLQPPGRLRGHQRRRAAGRGPDVSDAGLARAAGDEYRAHVDAALVRNRRPRGGAELSGTRAPQYGTGAARGRAVSEPARDARYRQLREPGPRRARAVGLQRPLRVRLLPSALRLQSGRATASPPRSGRATSTVRTGGTGPPPRH